MFPHSECAVTIAEKFPETLRNERTLYSYERVHDVMRDDYWTRKNVTVQEELIRYDILLTKIMIRSSLFISYL